MKAQCQPNCDVPEMDNSSPTLIVPLGRAISARMAAICWHSFVMVRVNSGIWRVGVRVADLGMGLGSGSVGQAENTGLHFDADSQRLIVWYINGRSYLLDLHWLESMRHIGSSEDSTPGGLLAI